MFSVSEVLGKGCDRGFRRNILETNNNQHISQRICKRPRSRRNLSYEREGRSYKNNTEEIFVSLQSRKNHSNGQKDEESKKALSVFTQQLPTKATLIESNIITPESLSGSSQVKTRRRSKSLVPKTIGPQYPLGVCLSSLAKMTDELIEESELLQRPVAKCHTHHPSGVQASISSGALHDQKKHSRASKTLILCKRYAKPAAHRNPDLRKEPKPGSTMDEYKGLTDKELIARLKKYSIPHGPIVGSTRKLYEKKIYEHETERTHRTPPGGSVSYVEPSHSESYIEESFVSPRSRDNLNYGREALGSSRTYLRETYDSPKNEEYSTYRNEDPSSSKSYLSYSYRSPRHEGRSKYATEDWDVNSSETATSSYSHYLSSAGSDTPLGTVSSRPPITEPYPYNSDQKDIQTERDNSFYQSIFHRKSPGVSSLGVEPRRAIRPERQTQAAERVADSSKESKRYLPFWPQFLLFVLLAGFLAFVYFFLQGGADDNPFVKYLGH